MSHARFCQGAWAIFKRDIWAAWSTPSAYVVVAGVFFLAAFFFFAFLDRFNLNLQQLSAVSGGNLEGLSLNSLVLEGYFQMLLSILVFFVPLLTMRSIADERRLGTFDLLLSAPVTEGGIIFGKFLAVAAETSIALSLCWVLPWILACVGEVELGPIWGGMLGTLLCSLAFVSVGLAASAWSRTPFMAAGVGIALLLLLSLCDAPFQNGDLRVAQFFQYLTPVGHAREMISGVVSLKALVYFATLTIFGVVAALEAIRSRGGNN